jgi:uncharacterized membrane protein
MAKKHESTSGDLSLDRLVFFSDAVFAIAITLLVLEIAIPHLGNGQPAIAYWRALLGLVPSLFAFVLSFLVIGRFWMGHHERFAALDQFDPRLLWPNMLYLMAIAFMPFATAFLGANLGHFVPALVYNSTMVLLGMLAVWVARTVSVVSGKPDANGYGLDIILAALTCVVLTFIFAPASQCGMMTVPLWGSVERRLAVRKARLAAA